MLNVFTLPAKTSDSNTTLAALRNSCPYLVHDLLAIDWQTLIRVHCDENVGRVGVDLIAQVASLDCEQTRKHVLPQATVSWSTTQHPP
jgi:hypothetical protein